MLLPGGVLAVGGPLPRIRNRQCRRQDQHLADAVLGVGGQDHPAQPRIDRNLRQPPPDGGELGALEGAELLQQRHSVADAAGVGRVEEAEALDVTESEGGHLQDDRGEVGAQDLRLGVARACLEVAFGVQPDTHPGRSAPGSAGPLRRRRLRDRLDRQPLHLGPAAVAGDARGARIDHVPDTRHGQRRFGDVGGQHDPRPLVGGEHLLLLGGRQPGIQRQHLHVRPHRAPQGLGGVADLPFPGQEHQHITRGFALQLGDRIDDGLGLVAQLGAHDIVVGVVRIVGISRPLDGHHHFQWPIADFDRVGAPGHLDDRGGAGLGAEVGGESLRLDGRRGDDHLQVRAPRQQLAQIAEQEVDVEAALVRFVDDQRVVAQQAAVALDVGEQDAVGHQPDQGAVAGLVGESHGVADRLAQRGAEFVGDAGGDGACSQPARLRVADGAADTAAEFQTDLGQLGGLARAGLAGHDHHLVGGDRGRDVGAFRGDRQIGVADLRYRRPSGHHQAFGRRQRGGELVELFRVPAELLQTPAEPGGVAEGDAVEAGTQLADRGGGRVGHLGRRFSACRATSRPASRRASRTPRC